jgi:hypothetical protein
MHHEGMAPNQPNLVSVLSVVSRLENFDILGSLHAHSLKTGLDRDVVVGTAMLNAYTRNASIKFFDCMTERNEYTWSTMIAALSQGG